MGEVVNLRMQRKRAARAAADKAAMSARALHGRSGAEKKRQAAQDEAERRRLDAHRLDRADSPAPSTSGGEAPDPA